jgi:hypothetical protein
MLCFESPTSPRRLFVMALSKANQKLLVTGKIIIMPILAALVYSCLLDFYNLKSPYIQPQEANLVKLCIIALLIVIGNIILLFNEMSLFWSIIVVAIFILAFTPLYFYSIKILLSVILYFLCLYSIDIIIFMMRFLERRIHQNHTPR